MNQELIDVKIEQRDDAVVVARLTGELDISVAEKTGRQIAEAVPSSALGVVVSREIGEPGGADPGGANRGNWSATAVPLNDGDRVHVGAWTTITIRRG